jgi:hypothetical protein
VAKKNRKPFIKLSIIFGMVILITIFYEWGTNWNKMSQSSMMSQSMGDMMSGMKLKDVTMKDLIRQQEMQQGSQNQQSVSQDQQSQGHNSHHASNGFMGQLHSVTTRTILILLPFIIAGSVFLAIIWFDSSREVKK